MSNKMLKFVFLAAVASFSFFARLFPHIPNFTPIGALFLLSGTYFKKTYILIPAIILISSDFFIGFYDVKIMATVYGSFVLMGLIGFYLKKNRNFVSIASGALLGSFVFFLTTNYAVWFFGSWYPGNFSGLAASYIMAVPFFKNSLMGDMFYTLLFFGAYELFFNLEIVYLLKKKLILIKIIFTKYGFKKQN